MRGTVPSTLADAVDAHNEFQDRLIDRYVRPHAVTLTYWAFAAVFLYFGAQKVLPHRSTADVQLATVGGLIGAPYLAFVAFVGLWQMAIGASFLLRRLRLAAIFFVTYQVFALITLIVLHNVVFQPPYLTVVGIEIPWALGMYAAFLLKNLVLAGGFFVLASVDASPKTVEDSPGAGNPPAADVAADGGTGGRAGGAIAAGSAVLSTVAARIATGVRAGQRWVTPLLDRVYAGQDWVLLTLFRPHGVAFLYLSFAFVFFYFGFQKPAPVYSPVRTPLSEFFAHFPISLAAGMLFIGTYEMFLGLLFYFRQLRLAFWLFLSHQAITLASLLVIPHVAFQPPWIDVLGVQLPWATTGYGEFVLKNVVFVAAFLLLASVELGTDRDGDGERPEDGELPTDDEVSAT